MAGKTWDDTNDSFPFHIRLASEMTYPPPPATGIDTVKACLHIQFALRRNLINAFPACFLIANIATLFKGHYNAIANNATADYSIVIYVIIYYAIVHLSIMHNAIAYFIIVEYESVNNAIVHNKIVQCATLKN